MTPSLTGKTKLPALYLLGRTYILIGTVMSHHLMEKATGVRPTTMELARPQRSGIVHDVRSVRLIVTGSTDRGPWTPRAT